MSYNEGDAHSKFAGEDAARSGPGSKVWIDAFDETRRKLLPKARAMGIYTDEDVFKIVS